MPTIKDIAARAGVSHGAVSNVLNKRGNVSAEKIQLVEQAARELGYQLNAQAAGRRTYMLVCMGAAIVMATGHYMQEAFQTGDPARLGAQVISGIGFYSAGILATLAVYLIMARFKKLEYKFILEDVYCGVYVEFNGTVTISDIAQRILGYGLEIEEVQMGKPGYGA